MLKPLIAAAATATMFAAAPLAAGDRPTGEEKLAKLLEGREAGEAQRCIRTFGPGKLQIIDKTAIVYRKGDTVWVNRTRNPDHLDDDDALVIRKFDATKLCRLDQVTTRDRHAAYFTGAIFLTDFVPYKKAS